MTQSQANIEEVRNAIKCIEVVEGTRLTVCPEDYPPSEWTAYKHVTAQVQRAREELSALYMLMNNE